MTVRACCHGSGYRIDGPAAVGQGMGRGVVSVADPTVAAEGRLVVIHGSIAVHCQQIVAAHTKQKIAVPGSTSIIYAASYRVCAAATDELHHNELMSINMIYCHVVQSDDVDEFLQ